MTRTDIDAVKFEAADICETDRDDMRHNLWLPYRKVTWLRKCRHLRVYPEKGEKWK